MRTPSALARLTAGRRNDPWPAVTLLAGSRLCRRARLAVAAAGCAAIGAAVTFALAADVAGLILARILQGVAVGVASPALASIVRRHSSGQRAGLRAGTAATAGGGAGALLAGLGHRRPLSRSRPRLCRCQPAHPQPGRLRCRRRDNARHIGLRPYGWLALHRLLSPKRHGAGAQTVGAAALTASAAATAGASAVGGTAMLLLAATAAGAGLGLCFVTAARTVFDLARTRGDGPLTAWYASNYLGTASAVVGVGLLSTTTSLTGSVRAIAATVTAAVIGWLAAALLTSRRRSRR